MLLIVGGEGSGKRSFAKSLGYNDNDIADAVLNENPVLCHLEQIVFSDPENTDTLFSCLKNKEVVICNEVGSGVIPANRAERAGREATGRLCVLLAQQASCVVRMVSGLPMIIKGELPCR